MTHVTPPCFHAPMAKHEASDGTVAHPLVEAALRRRRSAMHGAHRAQLPGQEGPIGWPGPDHEDERSEPVGWPGGSPESSDAERAAPDDQPPDEPEKAVAERRRGWRRLLGRATAA